MLLFETIKGPWQKWALGLPNVSKKNSSPGREPPNFLCLLLPPQVDCVSLRVLQMVSFYDAVSCRENTTYAEGTCCLYQCKNCIQPQVLEWESTVSCYHKTKKYLVALPGKLDVINIKSDINRTLNGHIKWLDSGLTSPGIMDPPSGHSRWGKENFPDRAKFPVFSGYQKFSFVKWTPSGVYRFVKYMDSLYNEEYFYENENKAFDPCPQHAHNPKLFSWVVAQQICQKWKGDFPEFLSKEEHDEFLHILKSSDDLFPIDAVHIGLKAKIVQVCFLWILNSLPIDL